MSDKFNFSLDKVNRYYEVNTTYYRLLWSGRKSLGLHHGYYDSDVKTHDEAVNRVNETLANLANIREGDRVLDAGCGVGGSSLWLAKNIGAKVTGITIVDKQIRKANKYAKEDKVEDKVEFLKRDFNDTGFPDNTFDAVIGIESLCYAVDKEKMLKELYRVLKPGGKIAISDGFQVKAKMTEEEEIELNKFVHNFEVESFATPEEFKKFMENAGFVNIKQIDRGKDLVKNFEYGIPKAKRLTWAAKILPHFSDYFKEVAKSYYAGRAEETSYNMGLWTLQAVVGTKPKN